MTSLNEKLQSLKVIPVIAIKNAEDAVPLGKVLVDNGMPCAEITFRTEAAAQAIKNMRAAFPDMLIGAGTVLNSETVDQAIDAGVSKSKAISVEGRVDPNDLFNDLPVIGHSLLCLGALYYLKAETGLRNENRVHQ